MSKLGPISHLLSQVSCVSLVLQGLRCEWGAGVLNLVLSLSVYVHKGAITAMTKAMAVDESRYQVRVNWWVTLHPISLTFPFISNVFRIFSISYPMEFPSVNMLFINIQTLL